MLEVSSFYSYHRIVFCCRRNVRQNTCQESPVAVMESLWTWVDGTLMHALVSPSAAVDAPPLVLVHGVIASSDYLAPTAELLAPDFLVYLPDLPGYGRSKPSTRRMDVPGLADALVAWMDAVGLPQANFLGNSFGCQILADLKIGRAHV